MSAKKKTSVRGQVAEHRKAIQANRGGSSPSRKYHRQLDDAIGAARVVALRAQLLYGDTRSGHEGWGVLAEEFDEFKEAVREKQSAPGRADRIRAERIDIAASALRIAAQIREVTR